MNEAPRACQQGVAGLSPVARGTSHFGGARRWSQINASPIASEAIERIGQFYGICFRIQTIEFRCADEAVDRRPALSVGIGACEQSDSYCNTS
jgi:hypothetical protein